MAQKILGIKLEVDTSGLGKLVIETEKVEKALKSTTTITEKLTSLELARASSIAKISTEQDRLQQLIDKTNTAIVNGDQKGNLAAANMQRSIKASNSRLQEQLELLNKISLEQSNIHLVSGRMPTSSTANYNIRPGNSTVLNSGLTQQEAPEVTKAKELAVIKDFNAATEAIEKEAAARRLFHTTATNNAIQVSYAELFDKIAAKEAQAARNNQSFADRIAQRSFIPKQNSEVDVAGGMSKASLQQEVIARNNVSSAIARQTEQMSNYNNVLRTSNVEHKSLLRHVGEIMLSYRLLNTVVNTVKQAFLNVVPAGFEQQATQASLIGIFGSQQAAENLKFVSSVADSAGQSISTLEQSYRRFAPSAVLAGASLEQTNQSFKDFADVSAILHLSSDKVNSVFLALDQMFAKGVVQSEEIKKQLGNVLPAAVEIGAQAIGKTPAQFMEAMKKNEVVAKDFVPKFSELYRKIFAGPGDEVFNTVAERLFANTQRLKNQYEIFNRGIYAELQGTLNTLAKGTVDSLKTINENLNGIIQGLGILSVLTIAKVAELTIAAALGANANRVYAASFTELAFAQGRFTAVNSIAAGQAVAATGVAVQGAATASASLFGLSRLFTGITNALTSPLAVIAATVTAITSMTLALAGAGVEYQKFAGISKTQVDNLMATYAAQGKGAEEAGAQLQELARLQDKSNSFFITYQGTQIQFASVIQAVWNNIKQSMQAVLDFIKPAFTTTFTLILDVIKNAVSSVTTVIVSLIGSVVGALEGLAASASSILNDIEHRDYTGILDRASTAFTESQHKGIKEVGDLYDSLGSKVTAVGTTIASKALAPIKGIGDSILTNAKLIQEAENKKRRSENPSIAGTPPAVGLDDNSLEAVGGKTRKDLYKNLTRDSKLATEAMQADLKQLNFAYNENLISINSYFEKKKQLQIADIEQQLKAVDSAKGIAVGAGDIAKVEQYTDELENLYRKAQDVQTDLDNEKFKALEQYNQKLQEVKANALEASGNLEAASSIRTDIKYLKDELLLKKNGTVEQQKQLAVSKQYEISKGILAAYDAKATAQLATLNAEEVSTNIARENGMLSQQQASERLTDVKLKILEIDKESVAQLEKQVALLPGNIDLINQLNAAKAKVQQDYAGNGAVQRVNTEGMYDFASKYNTDSSQIDQQKTLDDLKSADDFKANAREQQLASNAADAQSALEQHEWLVDQKAKKDEAYDTATRKTNLGLYSGMAGLAANTFEGITSSMIKMYGAQSKQAKAAFMAYKAFAIAQTVMSTAQAVMAQLSNPTPYVGIALAAVAAAMGAIQVAKIIAEPMPQAHAGLDYVPEHNQTYVLSKGERVLAPQQNKDFTKFLAEGGNNTAQQQPQNIRIINAVDPELFSDWATSSSGERVIMNVVRRNQNA